MSLFYPNSPIFGTKSLPRRRFLQHYYRDTFIESHRKPIEVPQISLFCSMLALIPQSGDFSGAVLGVRSVALLQVAKLVGHFSYTKGILKVYKRQVLWNMVVLSLSISHKIGIFLAHIKKKYYLCAAKVKKHIQRL